MMKAKKAKVYIDGANMFYTQKKLGWFFDWAKIRRIIERQREILEWKYYVGVKQGDEKMQSYLRYLDAIGFTLFTKPLKKIKLEAEDILSQVHKTKYIYKANLDVEMATDILLDKAKINEIIMFTGDSDFHYVAKRLKDTGKSIAVYSSRKTISWELKLEASRVIYLEDLKEEIKRT